jgi:hypothetical protein
VIASDWSARVADPPGLHGSWGGGCLGQGLGRDLGQTRHSQATCKQIHECCWLLLRSGSMPSPRAPTLSLQLRKPCNREQQQTVHEQIIHLSEFRSCLMQDPAKAREQQRAWGRAPGSIMRVKRPQRAPSAPRAPQRVRGAPRRAPSSCPTSSYSAHIDAPQNSRSSPLLPKVGPCAAYEAVGLRRRGALHY